MALYDASFRIEENQVVGFLGPNGAGKSTTMNMLTGYLNPTWGSVKIQGIDMREAPTEARKHIGYLPEIPPVYTDLTVEEQLRFACEISGVKLKGKKREAYIASVCERTQIADIRRRLIRNLSKGYRQRVAVAQLLIGDPEILILDEPTVGLDPRQIREFRDLIEELGKTHTVILSSHILSEISSVCSRVLVFDQGELIADGDPENLQAALMGKRILELCFRGDAETLTERIRNLEQVYRVVSQKKNAGEEVEIEIDFDLHADIQPEIYECVKSCDGTLISMNEKHMSLEEIYLHITELREKRNSD